MNHKINFTKAKELITDYLQRNGYLRHKRDFCDACIEIFHHFVQNGHITHGSRRDRFELTVELTRGVYVPGYSFQTLVKCLSELHRMYFIKGSSVERLSETLKFRFIVDADLLIDAAESEPQSEGEPGAKPPSKAAATHGARKVVAQYAAYPLESVGVNLPESSEVTAVNVENGNDLFAVKHRHNNFRARQGAASYMPRKGLHVINDQRLSLRPRRSANTLAIGDAHARHRTLERAEEQSRFGIGRLPPHIIKPAPMPSSGFI